MNFWESVKIALESLKTNKLRSFLTMLGIIIGVSSVITITTIGHSIENVISNEFTSLGTNVLDILQSRNSESLDMDENYVEFTDEIIYGFEGENPGFHFMMEMQQEAISSKTDNTDFTYTLKGYNYGYYQYSNYQILAGRGLTKDDFEREKNACVITEDFAKNHFGDIKKSLGQKILVNTTDEIFSDEFVVVGVYKIKNSMYETYYGSEVNELVIPSPNMSETYKLYNPLGVDRIYLTYYYDQSVDASMVTKIAEDYFDKFNNTESIQFIYINMNDTVKVVLTVISVVTVVVSIIAAIALIVGGVGVMNIMLVSVIERTKEIGIQKALGARNKDIKNQFLVESVTICIIGCVIGILIGLLNGCILSFIAGPIISSVLEISVEFSVSPSTASILISTIFSSLIGIFFGLYPANEAAKLNPIDALRYE